MKNFEIISYKEIDSTSDELIRLFYKNKAFEGTVITAQRQTFGRGQGNNNWFSKIINHSIFP